MLSTALADERISQAEYDERLEKAQAAESFAALEKLIADLPIDRETAADEMRDLEKHLDPTNFQARKIRAAQKTADGKRTFIRGMAFSGALAGVMAVCIMLMIGRADTTTETSSTPLPKWHDTAGIERVDDVKVPTRPDDVKPLEASTASDAVDVLKNAGVDEFYVFEFRGLDGTVSQGASALVPTASIAGASGGAAASGNDEVWITMQPEQAPQLQRADDAKTKRTPITDLDAVAALNIKSLVASAHDGVDPEAELQHVLIYHHPKLKRDVVEVKVLDGGQKNFFWDLATGDLLPNDQQKFEYTTW